MTGRERILSLLDGKAVDYPPVMPITMMFAARHFGVKYRDYVDTPHLFAQAQLHTARTFGFDYVSCISDPAREAADCGAPIIYFHDEPPSLDDNNPLLRSPDDFVHLKMPDPHGGGRMTRRLETATLLREGAGHDFLVEGWIEGPIAEAADLRGLNKLLMDFYDEPHFVNDLLEFCTELGLRFARAQLEAGVELIGVGDAAASLIGPAHYEEFVWPYQKRLVTGLHAMGARVRLHICGNTTALLEHIGELGCDIVDLDYPVNMQQARLAMPQRILLGNLNPVAAVRQSTPLQIHQALRACHAAAGEKYVVGAGCEIPRDTPCENVRAFAEYARKFDSHGT